MSLRNLLKYCFFSRNVGFILFVGKTLRNIVFYKDCQFSWRFHVSEAGFWSKTILQEQLFCNSLLILSLKTHYFSWNRFFFLQKLYKTCIISIPLIYSRSYKLFKYTIIHVSCFSKQVNNYNKHTIHQVQLIKSRYGNTPTSFKGCRFRLLSGKQHF